MLGFSLGAGGHECDVIVGCEKAYGRILGEADFAGPWTLFGNKSLEDTLFEKFTDYVKVLLTQKHAFGIRPKSVWPMLNSFKQCP